MEKQNLYKGIAYVVGINKYKHVTELTNAVYDAESIANALKELNFIVYEDYDINYEKFIEDEENFCNELKKYDVGIFYFAGHGIEFDGINYLLDTDTDASQKNYIKHHTFALQDIINDMHNSCKMNIQIIDACRDNPYRDYRGLGTINLSPVIAPKGTIIAYSTSPGEKALDGGMGKNSIYTGALLQHLKTRNIPVEEFFKRVRTSVYNLSDGKQTSWEHTSLIGSFSFNSGMLIQSKGFGYSNEAFKLSTWPSDSRINNLLEDFLSGTFEYQKRALNIFLKNDIKTYTRDELFVIGRCIMRSAEWNSFACITFIENKEYLSFYINKENSILDGMLYEIYFDDEGNFNANKFYGNFLNELIINKYYTETACSFKFIENILEPFKNRLLFIPKIEPETVVVDLYIEMKEVTTLWEGKAIVPLVTSIKHENTELLDEEGHEFDYNRTSNLTINHIKDEISHAYCIPETYLQIVCNKPECDGKIEIKGGFKKF